MKGQKSEANTRQSLTPRGGEQVCMDYHLWRCVLISKVNAYTSKGNNFYSLFHSERPKL